MQNYELICVYANEFSAAAVWGNLTRIFTDFADFSRRSVFSLTDFTDFADFGGKVFNGLSVR